MNNDLNQQNLNYLYEYKGGSMKKIKTSTLQMVSGFHIWIEEMAQELYKKGFKFLMKDDSENAIKNISKAIDIKLDFKKALFARGIEYFNNNCYNMALNDFNNLLKTFPYNDEMRIDIQKILYYIEEEKNKGIMPE